MERDLRAYIWELQKFTDELLQYTTGLSMQEYYSDRIRRLAIERLFILIATVLQRMERVSAELDHRVNDLRSITGFRNILVHEYDSLEDDKVMSIMQESLPKLKQQIDAWATELGMEAPRESAS